MSRLKIATKEINADLSGVTITFTDGSVSTGNLGDFTPEIVTQLALHGLSQKMGDSYSGESDIAVARAKADRVVETLKSGDWKAVREGGSGGKVSDLANALATVTGKPIEECVAKLADMDKAQKSGLRKHPKIAAEVARMAAERAMAKAEKAQTGEEAPLDF